MTIYNPKNKMTLSYVCIPRIEYTIEESYIRKILARSNLGYIKKYTEIEWKNDRNYKRVLMVIHWNPYNDQCVVVQDLLKNDQCINIVYDFPKVWKMYIAKN